MDQTNNVARSLVQTMVNQAALSGTGKAGSGDEGFHRLLEKVKISRETLPDRPPDAEISPVRPKLEKASAPKQTDTVEQAKKLAEQGYALVQPVVGNIQMDLAMEEVIGEFAVGEYVLTQVEGDSQVLPMADLASLEQAQPQQLPDEVPVQTMDVSDPEADAILEATAPGADNSPAALLEKIVDEEIGHVAQQAMEGVQPQQEEDEDDGIQAELTDVEQAPQHIFHDVENVPVKVGEAESAEQTNEADVVQQVENQIGQVIQSGESTVTVRLNPENLGEVTVEVSMKSDGIVNVAISARNDDTRALLERHTAHLQELVSSRTQQSVEVNVQRQQESQQNQNQQHSYDGRNGHAQDGQQERRQRRGHASSQDFIQQLRLGLIPTDGES